MIWWDYRCGGWFKTLKNIVLICCIMCLYYTRKLYEMRKNQNQVSLHVHINWLIIETRNIGTGEVVYQVHVWYHARFNEITMTLWFEQTCTNGMFGSMSNLVSQWMLNMKFPKLHYKAFLRCRSISPQFCMKKAGHQCGRSGFHMAITHGITWICYIKKHAITYVLIKFGHWFEINRLTLHFH